MKAITDAAIEYIRKKMTSLGGEKAIIGISGGKDSTVTAALCVKALGSEKVFGVLMPQGDQKDLTDGIDVCKFLEMEYVVLDIEKITEEFFHLFSQVEFIDEIKPQTRYNLPPRVRMSLLYGISQSMKNTFVINTSNLSEDWVGYATIYGDTAGAFSPLGHLTSEEVIEVGRLLGLPERFLVKPPADGLTGKTDEEVLGFSYDVLNKYLRTGEIESQETKKLIDDLHRKSRFKFLPIEMMEVDLPIVPDDIAGVYKKKKE